MFAKEIYISRRKRLLASVKEGVILLLGNSEASCNYPDNQYQFRQDSSFLYFFGLDKPSPTRRQKSASAKRHRLPN